MSSDVKIITPKICKVKITTVEKGIIYSTKQRIIAQPIVDWNFRGNSKLPTDFRRELFFIYSLLLMYSSIALAAVLPAPIARITVAAPVTASPPA